MEKVSGIYRIVCKANGDYYYGSSKNIWYRWSTHTRSLKKNTHYNNRVQRNWNKYGELALQLELTELIPNELLLEVENKYLKEHVGKPHCMNIAEETGRPPLMSVNARKKISDARKAYFANPENRKKQSDLLKAYCTDPKTRKKKSEIATKYYKDHPEIKKTIGKSSKKYYDTHPDARKKVGLRIKKYYSNPAARKQLSDIKKAYYKEHPPIRVEKKKILTPKIAWNKGLKGVQSWSAESKQKLSKSQIGHPTSVETRQKISNANTGKIRSEEYCQKMSERMKGKPPWNKGKKGVQVAWSKGKTMSDETKQKMSNAKKAYFANPENRKKRSERITNAYRNRSTV